MGRNGLPNVGINILRVVVDPTSDTIPPSSRVALEKLTTSLVRNLSRRRVEIWLSRHLSLFLISNPQTHKDEINLLTFIIVTPNVSTRLKSTILQFGLWTDSLTKK